MKFCSFWQYCKPLIMSLEAKFWCLFIILGMTILAMSLSHHYACIYLLFIVLSTIFFIFLFGIRELTPTLSSLSLDQQDACFSLKIFEFSLGLFLGISLTSGLIAFVVLFQ